MVPMHVEQTESFANKYLRKRHPFRLCVEWQDLPSIVCDRNGPHRGEAQLEASTQSHPARQWGESCHPRCGPCLPILTPFGSNRLQLMGMVNVQPPFQLSHWRPRRLSPPPTFRLLPLGRATLRLPLDSNRIWLSPEPRFRADFPRRSPRKIRKGQTSPCFLEMVDFRLQRTHPPLRRAPLALLETPATRRMPSRLPLVSKAVSHLPTRKRRHR